jgi:hypothetical protein
MNGPFSFPREHLEVNLRWLADSLEPTKTTGTQLVFLVVISSPACRYDKKNELRPRCFPPLADG